MSRSVLLVRLLIWCLGGCAIWAVLPRSLGLSTIALLVLAIVPAMLPALFPGRWLPLAFGTFLVLCWIGRTGVLAEGIDLVALLVLAITAYAQHSLCALAANVPRDAVVTADVLKQWLRRATPAFAAAVVGVLLTGLMVPTTMFGWSGAGVAAGWRDGAWPWLILLGLLSVPALAAIPVRLLRRRSSP